MDDYAAYDGVGLAELVGKHAVTPAELVEAAIARIERHDGKLNAVVYRAYDEARRAAAADLPPGPFRGVPFLIKDLGPRVAGWPNSYGSRFARDVVDDADSGLTARYRAAGVVLLGKTNAPEFGITGTTEGAHLGACRSPWNTDHIAGGSSGGTAAAVAGGIVPMAHGNDGLGSIRIPAACCGLVGLKPTRDRVPNLPDGFDYAIGLVNEHVLTRTVRDTAVMLDATGVPEPGTPYATPPRAGPYADEVGRAPGRLRIAWPPEASPNRPLHPEVQATLERIAGVLKALGHEVIERPLDVDFRALYAAWAPMSGANFAAGVRRLTERVGREPEPDDFEPLTWANLRGGRRVTGEAAMWGMQELRALNRKTVAWFEDVDAYLSPVMTAPPPKIGWLDPVALEPREANRRAAMLYPYTPVFNMSGQPSISLPLGQSSDGLPIGMMFTARYGDEATLIRLAAQLEKECPWKDRRPPIWG